MTRKPQIRHASSGIKFYLKQTYIAKLKSKCDILVSTRQMLTQVLS